MKIDDSFYMELALNEAWKYQLVTLPNPAVGCVIVKNGKIISIEAHKEAGKPHAEIEAIKSAFVRFYPDSDLNKLSLSSDIHNFISLYHNGFFKDCEFYITLEPCNHIGKTPACADLLSIIKPKRIIIATLDPNYEASGGVKKLKKANIDVEVGICEKESKDLLYPFIKNMTSGFHVYKYASRFDGSMDTNINNCHDRYISNNKTLEYVHKIRSKIDLLLIGGNTVRHDKPTLDCRFISNEVAPDIQIYSNKSINDFDLDISLFKVSNRMVLVDNKLSLKNKYVLSEGGVSFAKSILSTIDMFLIILSAKFSTTQNLVHNLDLNLRILHSRQIENDLLVWAIKHEA